jgi:SMC interacting uncharacterized protein involved in chromosome segregation
MTTNPINQKIKEYTNEFYTLSIRVVHVEEDVENVGKYINGLRYEIQDEISIFSRVQLKMPTK